MSKILRVCFCILALVVFPSLSVADAVADARYNICCQTANASCQASCEANVRSFSCTREYSGGCSSSCSCF
jgi:hypothetical protein